MNRQRPTANKEEHKIDLKSLCHHILFLNRNKIEICEKDSKLVNGEWMDGYHIIIIICSEELPLIQ